VRGLSALFWGLPIALVICVQTATGNWFRSLNILPPLLATGLLLFGLQQLSRFQNRERIWQRALDRAKIFALLNIGLAPFLFWWHQIPHNPFFKAMVMVMAFAGLLFLYTLNPVLLRLSAMLPDETLRQETRAFSSLNRVLIFSTLLMAGAYHALSQLGWLSQSHFLFAFLKDRTGLWLILFLILMPLAMTMALLWKTKEVILASVFGIEN
jgi:hypothetical protein